MKRVKQAVILAGGLGTRLQPLTNTVPKPMVLINGKPFLSYIIDLLKKNSITDILILTGYLSEQIKDYFKDGKDFGVTITYSHSGIDALTGSRLYNAKNLIKSEFLLMYADNFWPLHIEELEEFWKQMKTTGVMTVYSNRDKSTKNNVFVNKENLVEKYDKSRTEKNLNGVDIGFFLLKKKFLDLLPSENISFEEVVLPQLISQKELAGYLTEHKYYGLSTLERIPIVEDFFKEKKVVFIDRDGVINKKAPKAEYIASWREFEFLPRVKEALKLLSTHNYTIIVVSNQAGIARGKVLASDVEEIHENLKNELEKMQVKIKDIYICPHDWDEGCFCRKPNPGMFFQAAADHKIDLYSSYCIGDDPRDIVAGNLAGARTILISKTKDHDENVNLKFDDLYSAAKYITTHDL